MSKDLFGMVVHSSPFEWYESVNCRGKRVEEMSVFDVSHHCNMLETHWKFLNVSSLLAYTAGKESKTIVLCSFVGNSFARRWSPCLT